MTQHEIERKKGRDAFEQAILDAVAREDRPTYKTLPRDTSRIDVV